MYVITVACGITWSVGRNGGASVSPQYLVDRRYAEGLLKVLPGIPGRMGNCQRHWQVGWAPRAHAHRDRRDSQVRARDTWTHAHASVDCRAVGTGCPPYIQTSGSDPVAVVDPVRASRRAPIPVAGNGRCSPAAASQDSPGGPLRPSSIDRPASLRSPPGHPISPAC